MPFLIPIGAAIGGSLLGSKLGKKGQQQPSQSSSTDPQDAEIKSLMAGNMRTGSGWAKELFPMAKSSLLDYGRTLQQPLRYWSNIMGGDRASILRTLSPEVKNIGDIYDRTFQSNSELNPRGGSTAVNASLPYEKAGQVASLINSSRSQAAGALGDIAGMQGSMAGNLFGSASGLLGQSSAPGSSLLSYSLGNRGLDLQKRGQNFDLFSGLGGSLFDIIRMFKGGK